MNLLHSVLKSFFFFLTKNLWSNKSPKQLPYFQTVFHLTRPTDNFRKTDRAINKTINEASSFVFEKEAKLNHVLAQIYLNKKVTGEKTKETKAKIKNFYSV